MTDEGAKFEPDWRLSIPQVLATHIKLALTRRGISWSGSLDTDERWEELGLEVCNGLKSDSISPVAMTELPRSWERSRDGAMYVSYGYVLGWPIAMYGPVPGKSHECSSCWMVPGTVDPMED